MLIRCDRMAVLGFVLLLIGAGDQVNCFTTPCPQPEGSTVLKLSGGAPVLCGVALSVWATVRAWLRGRDRP